jgi:hypothetical protein
MNASAAVGGLFASMRMKAGSRRLTVGVRQASQRAYFVIRLGRGQSVSESWTRAYRQVMPPVVAAALTRNRQKSGTFVILRDFRRRDHPDGGSVKWRLGHFFVDFPRAFRDGTKI